jgi:uncharacterized protein (TIGR02246 family)
MRLSRLAFVSLVLCSIVLPAVAVAGGGPQALDEAWKTAMLAGDLDAIAACYAPDAVMIAPGAPPARGRDAILATYQAMFGGVKVVGIEFSDSHYESSGSLGAAWGTASITMTHPGAEGSMTLVASFTSVSKKIGGKWVYVVDHVSHPGQEGHDHSDD